jgi:hypothetical protein
MQRVTEIRTAREERYFASRMKDAAVEKKKQARAEIEKSIELLAPAVASREQVMRNVVDSARARIASRKKAKVKQLNAPSAVPVTGNEKMEE